MSRSRTRASRALIGLLVVTLVLGVIAFTRNLSKSRAEEMLVPQTPAAAAPVNRQAPPATVTQAPLPAPAQADQSSAPQQNRPGTASAGTASPMTSTQPLAAAPRANPSHSQPQTSSSSRPLADGKAKMEAGDLLGARIILNDALVSGRLSRSDATAAKKLLSQINDRLIFSGQRFADDPYGGTYSVRSGDSLSRIAASYNVPWELIARLNGITDPRRLRAGQTLKVIQGPFHAVVNKSDFTMDIYLGAPGERGSLYVTTYSVGLGEDDSTPAGTWQVETHKKLRNPTYYSPRGEGIIHAGDPENPLGGFWIGLTGIDGHAVGQMSYGIHGTIEPESIGRMESMGCIRLHNEDIALVFDLLQEGQSLVIVKD